jgi:MSHA biogenesis protein MshQ
VIDSDLIPADVFDHPLLVQVTDARLQAAAQACACDLVFTGADGTTRLDHAVEAYDPGTGALTAWVSVPVLSGSEDTQLFLYYGNPTAVDQQDPAAVFGSNADLQLLGSP